MDFASSARAAENRTRWNWIVAKFIFGVLATFQGYGIKQNRIEMEGNALI